MKLFLDIGNTRLKWCLESNETLHYGVSGNDNWSEMENEIAAHIKNQSLMTICVASVASDKVEQQVRKWSAEKYSLEPEFVSVIKDFGGLKTCYFDVSRLGVDRWLAMLAGFHECHNAFIVIDAGSAITIDYVSQRGKHMGGMIYPGIHMLKECLSTRTSKVKFESLTLPRIWKPGCDTFTCVGAGLSGALEGLLYKAINYSTVEFEALENTNGVVFLTGGDAGLIGQWCPIPYKEDRHLVLKGIKLWHKLLHESKQESK